jgi:hypothetical protein
METFSGMHVFALKSGDIVELVPDEAGIFERAVDFSAVYGI